jgi:predicted Ser/Thr protein kinase
MNDSEPSDLWDRWTEARKRDPGLDLEPWVRSLEDVDADALDLLRSLVEIERQAEPPPLVDVLDPRGPTRFAGFRIVRNLGQGSSGVVFLAVDEREGGSGGEVALKILNPLLAAAPERRDSILHEARIAAKLDHAGIVRVLASGVERGYAWIATERIEGEPLSAKIDAEATREERARSAIEIGLQLARALKHAHDRGVIHRDLKPANVMLTRDGGAKILDFGLARAEGTAFAVSRTGEAVGTPLYMAPEQWRGDDEIGPWTDVFAVGLILWEIASGYRLAADGDLPSMLKQISSGRRRVSRVMLRELTPELAEIVSRCTESHPADRYENCAALEKDLLAAAAGTTLPIGSLPTLEGWRRSCVRHPWLCLGFASGAAIAFATGYYAWWSWPVSVTFREQRGSKLVWIDGELRGTSGITMGLRPGWHEWRARGDGSEDTYEGRFEVFSHEPLIVYKILEPPHALGVPLQIGKSERGRRAWVQVSTPLDEMQLTIDGRTFEHTAGITTFQLPLGPHRFRIEAAGCRPIERLIHIDEQTLCALSFELDRLDSPWTTTILYSPLEDNVQHSLVAQHDLQFFFEPLPIAPRPIYVNRAYWGVSKSNETGWALLAVDLGVPVHELDVSILRSSLAVGQTAFSQVEMGASPDDLITLARFDKTLEGGWILEPQDEVTTAYRASPLKATLEELAKRMQGHRKLFIRLSAGGVIAGGDNAALAQVLRADPLPGRDPSNRLLWSPALRIRAR